MPVDYIEHPAELLQTAFIGGQNNCKIVRKPYHYVDLVLADTTRLQSMSNIYTHLQILEESNLAAHAKHHSSVTKSRLNEHRDTRSKCWFVNHFLWMDDLIVDEKLQSLPYI